MPEIKNLPRKDWEDCPYCENTGTYVTYRTMVIPMDTTLDKNQPVDTLEPKPNYHRCHWCHNNPASVYNQRELRKEEEDKQ